MRWAIAMAAVLAAGAGVDSVAAPLSLDPSPPPRGGGEGAGRKSPVSRAAPSPSGAGRQSEVSQAAPSPSGAGRQSEVSQAAPSPRAERGEREPRERGTAEDTLPLSLDPSPPPPAGARGYLRGARTEAPSLARTEAPSPRAERGEREPRERGNGHPAHSSALQALHLLAAEDVDGARAILDPALASGSSDPALRLAAGVLRFFEQRYDEAISLMESARAGDPVGYLALARAARDVTKGFVRAEGEHFVVFHPPGKDEVLVPYLLETLEKQRAALGASLGWEPEGKLAVEIVRDPKELARVTTLEESEIRTTGTVAVCKFNKLMLLSPKALLKGYDWLDTAAHEYTHLVLTRKSRNQAPIWMQEGLAKWFERAWRGGGPALSPAEAALLRNAAEQGQLVTFEQMHPSLAKLPSQERAALAYAEVVVAVERIVGRAGPQAPSRILDLVADGRDAKDAVAAVVGVPFDRFLADWRQQMASRPLPRGSDLHLRRLRFRDDPKQRGDWAEWAELPDEKARGFARLGELLRARGRFGAARLEYGKAWDRVGARFPILADQYAIAAMASGEEGLAERILAEAIGWSPDHAALHVHLARLLARRNDLARARDHLLAANRQDPFDPEIHAGLARALAALGDPAGASREERFAKILGPEAPR